MKMLAIVAVLIFMLSGCAEKEVYTLYSFGETVTVKHSADIDVIDNIIGSAKNVIDAPIEVAQGGVYVELEISVLDKKYSFAPYGIVYNHVIYEYADPKHHREVCDMFRELAGLPSYDELAAEESSAYNSLNVTQ